MLEVTLLGGLHLRFNGKDVPFAARPKVGPLLAYLLINYGEPVSRDRVAFALWPDESEEAARANLRRHLGYLRELLPASKVPWVIGEGRRTIRWNPAARARVDVWDFERAFAASQNVAEAIERYKELLPGRYDEWIVAARESLRQSYLSALWELVQRARGQRNPGRAAGYLFRILTEDPWREDALRALMTVRCEAGDRSSALQLCADFEQRLLQEMDVALMPETTALRRAIEVGEPLPTVQSGERLRSSVSLPADLPFAGRDAEMERLDTAWRRAMEGVGSLILVVGEAGIGKSRLASEFALKVETAGGRVFWGTTALPERIPYQALGEALRSATLFIDVRRLKEYERALFALIVPESEEASALVPALETERSMLFDAVARAFIEAARARPLLVVLEDLHAAGPATLGMLEHVIAKCEASPILFLGTARSTEVCAADAFARLRRPLSAQRPLLVSLGPIAESATRAILTQMPSVHDQESAQRILSVAAGHPLFLAELLQGVSASREFPSRENLPNALRDFIAGRLEHFSPAGRSVLRAAAVAGNAFDREIVGDILGWSEAQIADAIDELIAGRVVREPLRVSGFEFEFTHDLLAVSAYESLGENERRRWHRRAARAAERWYASRVDELAGFIGRHWELGGEMECAAIRYLRAARRASTVFANDEALTYASRALELTSEQDSLRFDLLLVREEVCERIGDRGEQRAMLEALQKVAGVLVDTERTLEVLRRRESLHRFLGEHERAREVIAEMKRLGRGEARWQAIALRDEALVEFDDGSRVNAYHAAKAAAVFAAEANDPAISIRTLTVQATTAAHLGLRDEALALLERASGLAEEDGTLSLRIRVAYCRLIALTLFQAHDDVIAVGPGVLDLARTSGEREILAGTHSMLGGACVCRFKVVAARRYLNRAIELYRDTDVRDEVAAYNNLASLELDVGRLDRVTDALKAMASRLPHVGDAADWSSYDLIACELALRRQQYACAELLAAELAVRAGHRRNMLLQGEAFRCQGIALRWVGRFPDAASAGQRAVAILAELGAVDSVRRAEAQLALTYALAGDARAKELARRVLESIAEESGDAPSLLWALAQTLHAVGDPARADEILAAAQHAFVSLCGRLPSRKDRAAFAALPAHAQLLATASTGEWPSGAIRLSKTIGSLSR